MPSSRHVLMPAQFPPAPRRSQRLERYALIYSVTILLPNGGLFLLLLLLQPAYYRARTAPTMPRQATPPLSPTLGGAIQTVVASRTSIYSAMHFNCRRATTMDHSDVGGRLCHM